MKLNKKISISKGFQRSINIVSDSRNYEVLENYILLPSSEYVLETMVEHIEKSNQASFIWNGPYGAGKSSLAIFLSSLLNSKNGFFDKSYHKISPKNTAVLNFFSPKKSRKIIQIIGSTEDPIVELSSALKTKPKIKDILLKLEIDAKNGQEEKNEDGIVILIDELGKFLEQATKKSEFDIYIYQQIAELANRSNGKIIFIVILHQSFAEYSRNLPKASRDEWIKIQGRFIDITVNNDGQEQIELISEAIKSDLKPKRIAKPTKIVTEIISANKPISKKSLQKFLTKCWPLHPIVSVLIGSLSRKFGQNQRSIFSFLCSAEPFGFQHFLSSKKIKDKSLYMPSDYWNYLQANFENAILASNDYKIWALACEALNKVSASANIDESIDLIKTISVINIFKGSSGLIATKTLLKSICKNEKKFDAAIKELKSLNVIREDKYGNSFALFESSDFDIEEELKEAFKQIADVDFDKLNMIAAFKPIVAKKHYHETGAMRWMNFRLAQYSLFKNTKNIINQEFGEFVIIIVSNNDEYVKACDYVSSYECKDFPQVISVSPDYNNLNEFSRELLALEWIRKNSVALIGDKVARREVESKINFVSNQLNTLLANTALRSKWYHNGSNLGMLNEKAISEKASKLADFVFQKSPKIKSEMLNRNKPSSNANAALNILLKKMVLNTGEEYLGINGYPAEKGLFKILLEETKLYKKIDGKWNFYPPKNAKQNLYPLWKHTDELLKKHEGNVKLKEIYLSWDEKPFGIKNGLKPFLLTAYILSKKLDVGAYLNGTYLPEINDLFIDYLIKAANQISLRYVKQDNRNKDILDLISSSLIKANIVTKFSSNKISPLIISKELVRIIEKVNPWVLRTRTLSLKATKLREFIKSAHDPNKLIYDDIASLFDISKGNKNADEFICCIKEIMNAYSDLLEKLSQVLLQELQVDMPLKPSKKNIKKLNNRAEHIRQSSGDFRVDALATRLSNFQSIEKDMPGIASLAANKLIRDWIDLDVERALIEIAELCQKFRKVEMYSYVTGKKVNRHAIALTSSLSGSKNVHELSFDVLDDKKNEVEDIKNKIWQTISYHTDKELLLAAITETSIDLINDIKAKNKEKRAS